MHYANISFEDFKSTFQISSQTFLLNSKATFNSPVDGEGKLSRFKVGSYIKIDIQGPFNNAYVKFVGMEEKMVIYLLFLLLKKDIWKMNNHF